jgi:predicted DsbA family dithiol-disulfide isomerase/uncharacterized membrane protein
MAATTRRGWESRRRRRLRRLAYLGLAAAAAGLWTGSALLQVHFSAKAGIPSSCGFGPKTSCDRIALSEYSEAFGWPLPIYAILLCLALVGLFLQSGRRAARAGAPLAWASAVAGCALLYGIYLIGVQAFVLETWCLLCLALDLVLLAGSLVGVAAYLGRAGGPIAFAMGSARRGLRSTAGRIGSAALILGAVALVASGTALERGRLLEEARRIFSGKPLDLPWMYSGPSLGAENASVRIVVFSDYQCGACRRAADILEDLVAADPDVEIVHQDFPLDALCNSNLSQTLHPLACWASLFADCAGAQGRYWEFHDLIFARQRELSPEQLRAMALELSLDPRRFSTCVEGETARRDLIARVSRTSVLNIQRTPTLFINGYRFEGNPSPKLLRALLAAARERSGGRARTG